MKKMTLVLAVAGILSLTGLARASDPWNTYNFTLDQADSNINVSVTMTLPLYGGQTQTTNAQATGSLQAKIWQNGSTYSNLSQMQITDLLAQAVGNPSMTFKWKALFITIETATATANNVTMQDLADSSTYTHPVSPQMDSSGNFTLADFGTTMSGNVSYNASGIDSASGSVDLSDPSYNPQYNDISGQIVKNANGVRLQSTISVTGHEDLSQYISGASADYTITATLLSNYVPFQSVLLGDANCDHKVDVSDLGILAANYGMSGKTWTEGDYNGDGKVDVSDLGILAANYGTSGGAVPEPLTLCLLGFGGIGLLRKHS